MNLDALGCHYEDEHPGVFVGNDYVQYPSQTQTMCWQRITAPVA